MTSIQKLHENFKEEIKEDITEIISDLSDDMDLNIDHKTIFWKNDLMIIIAFDNSIKLKDMSIIHIIKYLKTYKLSLRKINCRILYSDKYDQHRIECIWDNLSGRVELLTKSIEEFQNRLFKETDIKIKYIELIFC